MEFKKIRLDGLSFEIMSYEKEETNKQLLFLLMTVVRNKKLMIVIILSLALVSVIGAAYFYLGRINIYESVAFYFHGISPGESNSIKIYGITPLNRENIIYKKTSENSWNDFGYYHSLKVIVPDSLIRSIDTISIQIGEKKYAFDFRTLKTVYSANRTSSYLIPAEVQSEGSLLKKISSIFQWNLVSSLLKILTIVCFVTMFLIIIIRRINRKKQAGKKIPVWLKITFISVIVTCEIFFSYYLIRYTLASFLTAVFFIIFCCFLSWLLLFIIYKAFRISERKYRLALRLLIVVSAIWLITESILRIAGVNQSHNEKLGLFYSSGFGEMEDKGDHNPRTYVYHAYYSYMNHTDGFVYQIKCNNEGLRDHDHAVEKSKDELRVICTGNSFTEGIGAMQDSTWPELLEKDLNRTGSTKKFTVINAGKSGSDPFFEYILLKEELLKYEPDLVLLAVGSSDYRFYSFRGGFERFTPDGVHYREHPAWEWLYAVSYIFRFCMNDILHYRYFLSPGNYEADQVKAQKDIKDCIYEFYKLSKIAGFRFAVVFYDDGEGKTLPLIHELKKEDIVPVIDLFRYNNDIVRIASTARNLYYWPNDGHCKARGYSIFAKGVAWNLEKMGILDTLTKCSR